MSNFTAADGKALFEAIRSMAKKLGIFSGDVITHDPEATPAAGRVWCSISLGPVKPVPSSGLAAVSGEVTLMVHVWSFAMQKPLDNVDPGVLGATCALMGAFAGGFTLNGTVREVDLFGMHAEPGYTDFEGKEIRAMAITVPLVINDMFEEVA